MPAVRIDAHQHFWRPERGDYFWMAQAPSALHRFFGPADLQPLLRAGQLDGSVLVQAAPTVAETDYLLGIADATPTVFGVVGWIDFEQPAQRAELERLAAHPRLVAVRPMVQDIEDDDWILRPKLDWAFGALQEMGLCFDALGYPRHARRFLDMCQRHPDLRVVLDHGLKPDIAGAEFAHWASDMRDLARNTSAVCKLSGLASEAGNDATLSTLRPYIEHLAEIFGPERLLWGSDWPVATTAIGYADWLHVCETILKGWGAAATARVFGDNARDFYRLDRGNPHPCG